MFILFLYGLIYFSPIYCFSQPIWLSKEQVKEDYQMMRTALLDAHPGLDLYLDEAALDHSFPVDLNFPDSSSLLEIYQLFASKVATIQDGHTSLAPGSKLQTALSAIPYLPFQLEWIEDQLVVINGMAEPYELSNYSVIQSINGISAKEIVRTIYAMTAADADNEDFKQAYNNKILAEQIRIHFGKTEGYKIEWLSEDGKKQVHTFPGLERPLPNQEVAYPLIELSLQKGENYAVLRINTFQHRLLNEMHIQFPNYIHAAFNAIKKSSVEHLIIDLRDNYGGENVFAIYLFAYLASQDFKVMGPAKTKLGPSFPWLELTNFPSGEIPYLSKHETHKLADTWTLLMNGIDSKPIYRSTNIYFDHLKRSHDIKRQKFDGQVYCLINGLTFSAASHFSSLLSTRKRVTFIGQAMGGAHGPSCGAGQLVLELPRSGFRLSIPFVQRQVADIDLDRGPIFQPNHEVKFSLQDRIHRRDPVMEKALELIGE
ncbi:MAG: S41 family peptidase [Bacteroidota bacterium]